MADETKPSIRNDIFLKGFLPGLVLGLVVGLVAGATLPTLLQSPPGPVGDSDSHPTDPRPRGQVPRDERPVTPPVDSDEDPTTEPTTEPTDNPADEPPADGG